jgi:hypothetical protein
MGKSKLCNWYGELRMGSKACVVGLESIKQARSWLNSDNSVNPGMGIIDTVFMIPQTSRAKIQTKGFYCLKVTKLGIEYLNITDLK